MVLKSFIKNEKFEILLIEGVSNENFGYCEKLELLITTTRYKSMSPILKYSMNGMRYTVEGCVYKTS